MTDPRIEAAARELKHLFSDDESTTDDTWFACAKCVLEAADAAAWRPIESAPAEETILACGGNLAYPTTVSWSGISGESWWTDSQEDHHDEIDPPTHWQPLPKPPTPCK